MIKLYGLKMSNYYSLTKALLIEKDLAFEEIKAPPSHPRITIPVPLWERCRPSRSTVSFCRNPSPSLATLSSYHLASY